jgi:hypothetical protein
MVEAALGELGQQLEGGAVADCALLERMDVEWQLGDRARSSATELAAYALGQEDTPLSRRPGRRWRWSPNRQPCTRAVIGPVLRGGDSDHVVCRSLLASGG